MNSFSKMTAAMVLSFLMDRNEDQEIPSQQTKPTLWDRLRSDGDTSWLEAALEESSKESCRGNIARQVWRNIAAACRLALFLRAGLERFCAVPGTLAAVVFTDFVLNLAVSFLLVGRKGYFAYSAVPAFFFHVPVLLLFGLWAGVILSRRSLLTLLPVALISLSIPIELFHALLEKLSLYGELQWMQLYLDAPHYYRLFTWWALASLVFLWRIPSATRARRICAMLLFILIVLLPLWFFARADLWVNAEEGGESGELHLTEEVLDIQPKLLDGELNALQPGRKGVSELYFVGFAGDATQDVFLKELKGAEQLFSERFGTSGRAVVLANNPQTGTTLPFATPGNLRKALLRVGQVMNRDEDILFLFLTSHGSKDHDLAVNNGALELDPLSPGKVRDMLKRSGIQWKVVVVSACYSGGFIDALKDSHTMVITAADATHESFGCGFGERYTWFGDAFLNDGLRQTVSFTEAFERARERIRQWEEDEWETPSNPQIWVGKDIAPRLARLEKELKGEKGER